MFAVITGGTSGLGMDMAISLARRGYDLFLVSRTKGQIEELRKKFPERRIEFLSCDLSREEDCYRLLKETEDLDVFLFVNNAGYGDVGSMLDTSMEKEVNMVKLNDVASLILIKNFLLRFIRKGNGRVLSVCSAASFGAAGYMNVYYASKAFVYSLGHGYHRELKDMKSKVTISMLCPGPIKTGFEERAGAKFSFHTYKSEYIAEYAVRKFLKGKLEIVPGMKMKLAHTFSHLFPKRFISKVLNKQAEIK